MSFRLLAVFIFIMYFQVLRVSSDLRRGHSHKFLKNSGGGILKEVDNDMLNLASASRKRKKHGKHKSFGQVHADGKTEEPSSSKRSRIAKDDSYSGKTDEICPNIVSNTSEDNNFHSSVNKKTPPTLFRKKKHQRKFYWSHQLDRYLHPTSLSLSPLLNSPLFFVFPAGN